MNKRIDDIRAAKTFGEILTASGMTLTAVGAWFGIPYRTLQNWKAGTRKPPQYTLKMMKIILINNLKNTGVE